MDQHHFSGVVPDWHPEPVKPTYPAILFFIGSLVLLVIALVNQPLFAQLTKNYPYTMGFLKLFLLGTLGELIKTRLAKRTWQVSYVFEKAAVWGLYGMWFTAAIPFGAAGTTQLAESGLWWKWFPPLSMSLWVNLVGGYALFMMVSHEYANFVIAQRWRIWSLEKWAKQVDVLFVFSFIPKTLIFWIPAHTLTYSLPPEFRVLMTAVLAIMLGFFLTVGKARR